MAAPTYNDWKEVLAPVVDNGVPATSTRLYSRIHEAQKRLFDYARFVARREDYNEGFTTDTIDASGASTTVVVVDNLTATKMAIMAAWREENNQVEMAMGLMEHAYKLVENDIVRAAEKARSTLSDENNLEEARLHNELPDGVKIPTSRLATLLTQAENEAETHQAFIQRREDYNGTAVTVTFEVKKKLVESYLATSRGEAEYASACKKEALELIERDVIAVVEAVRRNTSGEIGSLHNELPDGVKISTTRIGALLDQAGSEAQAHQSFVQRREDYNGNPPTITFEIKKKLVESYLATSRGESEYATACKKEAFELVERDVVAAVEAGRRAVEGEVGKLHNELPDGVKVPTTRLTSYFNQANSEAASHQAFVQRREDYKGAVPTVTFEVKKKLVESYLATSRGESEYATACKKEAFELIERDVIAGIEAARRDAAATEEGRLHNELPDGVKIPTARLTAYLAQAGTEAQAHQSFVQRREDYFGATPTVTFEIKKKLVESYLATSRGEAEYASACKKEAFELVERDIVALAESSRRSVAGDTGRLHNELPDGVKVPTSRLTAYLSQAVTEATAHQAFVQRREDYTGTAPALTFEIQKKLVESYLATSREDSDYASACKKEAFELIERDIVSLIEASRKSHQHPRINRLHNELPDGVKVPSTRMAVYRNQALADAAAHRRFLQREEDYTTESDPRSLSFSSFNFSSYPQWVQITNIATTPVDLTGWKILGHAYNENITPPCVLSTSLSPSTFVFPPGVTLAPGGTLRVYSGAGSSSFNNPAANPPTLQWSGMEWDSNADVAFLHSPEDTVGIDFPEATLTVGTCAMPAPDASTSISAEVEKKLVESYIATSRGEAEYAQTCKKEAFELIERDVKALVEETRKTAPGDVGRLHNEVPGGLKIKSSRMQEYLAQANDILTSQWILATRNEDLNLPVPAQFRWEAVKLCVQSLVYQSRGELEAAAASKQQALDVIDTEVRERFVSNQRDELQSLFSISDPDTLGHYVSRLGLDLAESGLSMPTSKLIRLINTAEETLFTKGRWAGTTQSIKITVTGSGEIELPGEIETPLGATFEGHPVAIMSRELEYAESGPGYLGGNKTNPVIVSAPTASPLVYGQTLAESTLSNGVASVGGTFSFLSPATTPNAGQVVQVVVFNPTDTDTYNSVEIEVPVVVSKATPTVATAPTAAPAPYGSPLGEVVLSGGVASVPGVFSFANPSLVPNLGDSEQSVVFTPSDSTNYNTVSGIGITVSVVKSTPVILVAPTATTISFGQTLGQSSLVGGVASVSGVFVFQEPNVAPPVGASSRTVRFIPQNTVAYNEATTSVSVTVTKATPSIVSVPQPSVLGNGESLSEATLTGGSAAANGVLVPGTFAFSNPSFVPNLGLSAQQVTFTPANTGNYNNATATVYVTVQKGTPTVTTVPAASAITYGQALSSSTLSGGVASVPGTFAFKTPSLVPASGLGSQVVVFTPSDAVQYGPIELEVGVQVDKANVSITTPPTASAIFEGQTLASSNLTGGVASVPGVFAFASPSTTPSATGNQNVIFTPTDPNYNNASLSVSVQVNALTITISPFPTASPIVFGQTLSSSTLSNGVANVQGTFVWKNPSLIPNAGTANQVVQFIPTSGVYETVEFNVPLTVAKATPTIISDPTASPIFFGETLVGASTLTGGSASVPGTWAFTASPSFIPPQGASVTVQVRFTPTDSVNYNTVDRNISVAVNYFLRNIAVSFTSNVVPANSGTATVPRVNSWSPATGEQQYLIATGSAAWSVPVKVNDAATDYAEISIFHTARSTNPVEIQAMSYTVVPLSALSQVTVEPAGATGSQDWTKLILRANATVTVTVAPT